MMTPLKGMMTYVIVCMMTSLLGGMASQCTEMELEFSYQILEEQSSGYYISNIKSDSRVASCFNQSTLDTLRFLFLVPPPLPLALDATSGVLKTSSRIDRDVLCARARDCSFEIQIAIQPVAFFHIFKTTLTILDLNDQTPTFEQSSLTRSLSEAASIGDVVLLPTARDDDGPAFGVTRYELRGVDAWAFQLRHSMRLDGVEEVKLELRVKLDREGKDRYFVKV